MRSTDAGTSISGAPALPQRLLHSRAAASSGHRTTEELLTALRKVPRPLSHPTLVLHVASYRANRAMLLSPCLVEIPGDMALHSTPTGCPGADEHSGGNCRGQTC